MKTALLLGLSAILCSCAAQDPHTSRSVSGEIGHIPSWFKATPPERIIGPVSYVGTEGIGAYLIASPKGHILIDGGMPSSAKKIECSIRQLGEDPTKIRYLLVSHAHIDHVGTIAHFKKLTGAKVVVLDKEQELLESGGRKDYLWYLAKIPFLRYDPVKADIVVKDGDARNFSDHRFTAIHTPGHTRGSTTWTTEIPHKGKRYKLVFGGATTLLPGTHLVKNPSYPGIFPDFLKTFAILEGFKDTMYLSNHAHFIDFGNKREVARTMGPDAYIDPKGFSETLAADKQKVLDKVAKGKAADLIRRGPR
ncbi:MAG TPA: subclass B3 metallo-beta-lactamase [Luteolibacter sp.]|nr:subclass B3 metallo-beta-lactamase [Luteolibacter sp.]